MKSMSLGSWRWLEGKEPLLCFPRRSKRERATHIRQKPYFNVTMSTDLIKSYFLVQYISYCINFKIYVYIACFLLFICFMFVCLFVSTPRLVQNEFTKSNMRIWKDRNLNQLSELNLLTLGGIYTAKFWNN